MPLLREPTPQEELKFAAQCLDEMAEKAIEEYEFFLRPAVIEAMLVIVKSKERILPKRFEEE
ncbi:hypothetical protein KW536_11275 [Vibrio fluvialis]|nr:hypothetical protein [Vibrio fluvialis]